MEDLKKFVREESEQCINNNVYCIYPNNYILYMGELRDGASPCEAQV